MENSFYKAILFLAIFILFFSCDTEKTRAPAKKIKEEKQIWVYNHQDKKDRRYTVFSNELPVNKSILPENFLAIRKSKKDNWNCLLKWEGDVLWFYTPSKSYFASNNSNNGKTQWTIVTQNDFDSLFYETKPEAYIRFSSNCSEPKAYCLESGELNIGY